MKVRCQLCGGKLSWRTFKTKRGMRYKKCKRCGRVRFLKKRR
ncbi:MAG: hypothetical protein QMC77_04175 [Methanocellales archaeon]|nr:hypothetical protein [Methanocellales archaeon]MDI6902912.1 hypothetical protein [Methanocellales archaeon]